MSIKKDVYFIGWDYASPDSVALKKVLMDGNCPWYPVGIVHDEVWVDSVDGIPLITARHFLESAAAGTSVVLFVQDAHHRLLWQRRCQEYNLIVLDEGQLFKEFSLQLAALNKVCDLGVVELPCAFDDGAYEALKAYKGTWKDAASNQFFRAYLNFLETGILADLRKVCIAFSEHPFFQVENLRLEHLFNKQQATLVWEVSSKRSAFIEQAILQADINKIHVAFSSELASVVVKENRNLKFLLAGLGITPQASVVNAAGLQEAISGFPMPDLSVGHVMANIAVDHPLQLLDMLGRTSSTFSARVRVGREPEQLLGILKKYAMDDISLRCERPGPSGLHVVVTNQ